MELRETSKTTLRNIYFEHPEILTNRYQLESLLKDHGYNAPEMAVLLQSFDEAIPRRIANPNSGVPPEVNLAKMVVVLQKNRFLDRNAATWAVDSWAAALGSQAAASAPVQPASTGSSKEPVDSPSAGKLKNVPPAIPHNALNEVKVGTGVLPTHLVPGNGPSPYKVRFRGDRLWKLIFGVFVVSRFVAATPSTMASLNDFYQDYSILFWIVIVAVVTFTSFSIERRTNPFSYS